MGPRKLKDIPLKSQVEISGPDESGMYACNFYAFNTAVSLKGYGVSSSETKPPLSAERIAEILQGVVALCREYEWRLSRTLEGSEIAKLNEAVGELVEVSFETAEALKKGLYYSAKSKGYFDISMGSVTRLWDFTHETIPDQEKIDQALERVNWRNVEVFEVGAETETEVEAETEVEVETEVEKGVRYLARAKENAVVDLGGMAKGLITDKICAYLQREGFSGAFVNLGGNVAVFGGKPDGSQWRIGIQSPFEGSKIMGVMSLSEGSVVTSGLYERCFEKNGVLYHHILDRKTGFPVETDIAGVSVIADASSDADGFSTTLFALGLNEALRFVKETPGIEAIFVTKDGETVVSKQGISLR